MIRLAARRRFIQLLLLVSALLPAIAGAVTFDERTARLPLGRELFVLEDSSAELRIQDVISPALDAAFRQHAGAILNKGYTASAIWLRVDLLYQPHQRGEEATDWLLELAYPPLDRVDLYLPDAYGGFALAERSGDSRPFADRTIKHNYFVFPLRLQPEQPLRLYLRIEATGSLQAPLTLWSERAFLNAGQGRLYALGIIYGVLLGMLLYNLFIFLSVRDSTYLFYILYIAAFGLYQVSANGVGAQFLWSDSPALGNAAPPVLIGATALFAGQFVRSFLQVARFSRWLDGALLLSMLVGAGLIGLTLIIGYAWPLKLAPYLAVAFNLLCFAAGIQAWRRGVREARFFLLAWSAFLLGGLIYTLMVLGLLPNNGFTLYASQIGMAIEVSLLSLALADRINTMRQERSRILRENSTALEALNYDLVRANRLKDEFLATVSHELRTPMNGVLGALQLMQCAPLTDELQQYRSLANTSAREMLGMIDELLLLAELQAGRLQVRTAEFRLRRLLDGLRQRFAARAAAKGLVLELHVASELADRLHGDAPRLEQALACLLDNALKFTAEGAVTLQVRRSESGEVCFEVSDSGIGFDLPDDGSLYEHFQQLDGSITRRFGGLGIGLAVCKGLVGLLGGRIEQESTRGVGSCFRIFLPLGEAVEAPR